MPTPDPHGYRAVFFVAAAVPEAALTRRTGYALLLASARKCFRARSCNGRVREPQNPGRRDASHPLGRHSVVAEIGTLPYVPLTSSGRSAPK
jgi:hypothetical protein